LKDEIGKERFGTIKSLPDSSEKSRIKIKKVVLMTRLKGVIRNSRRKTRLLGEKLKGEHQKSEDEIGKEFFFVVSMKNETPELLKASQIPRKKAG
jgi:hypothetical protein